MQKVSNEEFDRYYEQIQEAIDRKPKLNLREPSITWYYLNKSKGKALKIIESSYNKCSFFINDN